MLSEHELQRAVDGYRRECEDYKAILIDIIACHEAVPEAIVARAKSALQNSEWFLPFQGHGERVELPSGAWVETRNARDADVLKMFIKAFEQVAVKELLKGAK